MTGEVRSPTYRRRNTAATVMLAWTASLALASWTAAQEIVVSPTTANQLKYLEVGMSSGRVTAVSRFPGRTYDSTSQAQERREHLKLDLTGATPSLHYELETKEFRIEVELTHGNSLHIRRTAPEGAKTKFFEFIQPEEGKMTLVVGENPREKQYSVDTLWHLLVLDPELVQTELDPLLRLLKPGWPLVSQGKQLEEALYKQTDAGHNYDRRAWMELVEKLGEPHYAARREADRKLRELGQVVVPYLRNLNPSQLDAEQLYRIRTIVRSYGLESNFDTPESSAGRLAADPEIWYALASRAEGSKRAKIRTQLSQILGEPVLLDPDADETAYKQQLVRLRKQIDRLQAK